MVKMLLSSVFLAIFLLLLNCAESGRVLRKIKERVHKFQLHKSKQHILLHSKHGHWPTKQVEGGEIQQCLDHFDRQNTETFPQRFFVNEAYWDYPHGPVFLYIGGEGPISELSVLAGHHVDMASEHRALLVSLEHRFYGKSINPDGLETENLATLSSQQALVDLVTFHQYISDRFGLSHKNTWISFGGSYSGSLSAWLRGKFPHLVFGAVASSAPVKAKLDFSTYNKIVGLSLANEAVGGSDKCVADVRDAFASVEAALKRGNASEVAKDFGCCEVPLDLEDQFELIQSLADIIMGTVQYNEEGPVMSIEELCNVMTNKSEAFEVEPYYRLVRLVQLYHSTDGEPCLMVSHQQTVKELMGSSLDSPSNGPRQWLYQTCTEFGYYQTCEDSSCPFSKMLTLHAQTELCLAVFGISQLTLPSHIVYTNQYYGADHPHTHRVLYVNGGVDPWQELSVLPNGGWEEEEADKDQTVFIKDTAHCADMRHEETDDRPSLKDGRRVIKKYVAKWLKDAAWENMSSVV